MMRVTSIAVAGALAFGTAVARGDDTGAPPKLFRELGRSVAKAGFHLDDRDPAGWKVASICARDAKLEACKLMKGSWRSVIVADEKHDAEAVVQELWSFAYGSEADARRGVASLEKDFEGGPFNKHPFAVFHCRAQVIAIEGRARWHTARNQLSKHVHAWLDANCAAPPAKPGEP